MAALMAVLWGIQRRHGDAGIVDVFWSAGIGALAIGYALAVPGPPERRLLVAALGAGWGFRLALYLARRMAAAREEDGRYRALREAWGARFQRNLFLFYQGQGLSQAILSVPFLIVLANRAPGLGPWDLAATAVWIVSIAGETVADRQLAAFRADPAHRGRTCRSGLWGWSRHPNYFFEWLHWWTYVLMAVPAPFGWVNLFAPALMFWFLWKVTGIPATEARALVTRGEDYRDYQRSVSPFVPLPPRRGPA